MEKNILTIEIPKLLDDNRTFFMTKIAIKLNRRFLLHKFSVSVSISDNFLDQISFFFTRKENN